MAWLAHRWRRWLVGAGLAAGCQSAPAPRAPEVEYKTLPSRADVSRPIGGAATEDLFRQYRDEHPALKADEFAGLLGLPHNIEPSGRLLSFDPTDTDYFDRVNEALRMTSGEVARFAQTGVVNVDHDQDYSMGSAYFSIWGRELPVFVTTDSILHAFHRSYDTVLMVLETSLFRDRINAVLTAIHDQLRNRHAELDTPALDDALRDVDLYVTVARNLLAGAGAPDTRSDGNLDEVSEEFEEEWLPEEPELAPDAPLPISPVLIPTAEAERVIRNIADLKPRATALFGSGRLIDYSQFTPRGHYTKRNALRRYFRAMMWLGRADTGFVLDPHPSPETARQNQSAALLVQLLVETQRIGLLQSTSDVIDFLVGQTDSATPAQMAAALKQTGVRSAADLGDSSRVAQVTQQVVSSAAQGIRSTTTLVSPASQSTPLSALFQLFGQRFVFDSYVLSKVVFDSVPATAKQEFRFLPMGLDVMAALGNNYAAKLLSPELERYEYAPQLLAARRVSDDYDASNTWATDVYGRWLHALRALDDPNPSPYFPEALRQFPWQAKQLQTQLASWAELRHDTILYAKQSYSSEPICGYPKAYVEPYPAFFARMRDLAREAAQRLSRMTIETATGTQDTHLTAQRTYQVEFFENFAATMERLQSLAKKELAAQPFTDEEEAFLEKTIEIVPPNGSGGPSYSGWYPELIYGGEPDSYEPTIADVHTSPGTSQVLEVGTGSVNFLVVAVDNDGDRATYVGPVYSYYEFAHAQSDRLTDEAWERMLRGRERPPRPAWTSAFVQPAERRDLDGKPSRRSERADRPLSHQEQRAAIREAETQRLAHLMRLKQLMSSEQDRAAHDRAIDRIRRKWREEDAD